MDEIKETGGARIGMANATWPFATLIVNKNQLKLNASIIGNLVFKPSDIIAIQPYTFIPVLGQGIKIIHNVSGYNSNVIFWTMGSPDALIARIEQTGFLANTNSLPAELETDINSHQSNGGFPLKIPAAIVIGLIWNLFFLPEFINMFNGKPLPPLGIDMQLALGFIFIVCLLLLTSEPFRKLILKPDRTIDDIKTFIYITMLVAIGMALSIQFIPH